MRPVRRRALALALACLAVTVAPLRQQPSPARSAPRVRADDATARPRRPLTAAAARRLGANVLGGLALCANVAAPVANAAKVSEFDYAVNGRVIGIEEDAPFRKALGQIRGLLDDLGVEGAVAPERAKIPDGPVIARPYEVGLAPGTDRLRRCPDGATCLSSTRVESASAAVPHFVFFDQKGDAVGNLLELIYSAADADVLVAKGNFFNGAGVYVLVELNDANDRGSTTHDVEFQFLPGVLENVVDVRIVAREGRQFTTPARQRELLNAVARGVGWVPLDQRNLNMNVFSDEEKGIIATSALEIKYREQFEAEMEKADAELRLQMEKERKRIESLKKEVEKLVDELSRQEDSRAEEYRNLQSRSATARAEYDEGVNKRIGGVANDGRYAASQSIRLGNSFAGLINSKDDVTAKIYDNVQQDDENAPVKKNLFGKAIDTGKKKGLQGREIRR